MFPQLTKKALLHVEQPASQPLRRLICVFASPPSRVIRLVTACLALASPHIRCFVSWPVQMEPSRTQMAWLSAAQSRCCCMGVLTNILQSCQSAMASHGGRPDSLTACKVADKVGAT